MVRPWPIRGAEIVDRTLQNGFRGEKYKNEEPVLSRRCISFMTSLDASICMNTLARQWPSCSGIITVPWVRVRQNDAVSSVTTSQQDVAAAMSEDQQTDEALFGAYRGGDRAAFTMLVERYSGELVQFLTKQIGSRAAGSTIAPGGRPSGHTAARRVVVNGGSLQLFMPACCCSVPARVAQVRRVSAQGVVGEGSLGAGHRQRIALGALRVRRRVWSQTDVCGVVRGVAYGIANGTAHGRVDCRMRSCRTCCIMWTHRVRPAVSPPIWAVGALRTAQRGVSCRACHRLW